MDYAYRVPAGTDHVSFIFVVLYFLAIGSILVAGVLFAFSRAPPPETAKTCRTRASR